MESTCWTNCIKDAATFIFFKSSLKDKIHLRYLSTAIATSVKTEADTEMPWTMPLILQTKLPKGHPVDKRDALSWFTTDTTNCDSWHDDCSPRLWLSCNGILLGHRRNHQFLKEIFNQWVLKKPEGHLGNTFQNNLLIIQTIVLNTAG